MRYLNRCMFVVLGLFMSLNIFCQTNPFNAVFNLKNEDNVDKKNVLIVGIASEKNEGKYKLMIDAYGEALSLMNGNEVFTGKADSSVRQEHYLPLQINDAGEGEITARLYTFTDSMDVDSSSKREFSVRYTVKKKPGSDNYVIAFSNVKEKKEAAPIEPSAAVVAATTPAAPTAPGELTITDMKEVAESSPDNQQKFVINTGKRYNNFLRSLLFVFSFFIIGYLCYRILAKKHGV